MIDSGEPGRAESNLVATDGSAPTTTQSP